MVVNSYAAAGPKVARMDGFLALAKTDHFRDGRIRTNRAKAFGWCVGGGDSCLGENLITFLTVARSRRRVSSD